MKKGKVKRVLRVKRQNNSKKRISSGVFLFIAVLLGLAFVSTLVFSYVDFGFWDSWFGKPELIPLEDKCSVIAGRMIHQIRDAEDCKLQCQNACKTLDLEFDSFSFVSSNSSCHTCDCFCG